VLQGDRVRALILMSDKPRIEEVRLPCTDVIAYLEADEIRNVLDLWYLQEEYRRYRLLVCKINGEIRAHLGTYDTPEAIYTSLGGEIPAAEALLDFLPKKTVLITTKELGEVVTRRSKCDIIFPNDLMLIKRGEENLALPDRAVKLSVKDDVQYSEFGSSFNIRNMPMEWIREVLATDTIFGVFVGDELVSVASLVGRLPNITAIAGVETKPEFRGKGFGSMVVSAAVEEGLRRSKTCTLFVRQNNGPALGIYRKIGFKKVAEMLWMDIGTDLVP
jgi:ribosomal protein S18 acetylase RimI-like enzyme